jgi:hypothetical protein
VERTLFAIATTIICLLLLQHWQATQWIKEVVLDVVFVVGDYLVRVCVLLVMLLVLAWGLHWLGTVLTST